MVCEEDWNPRQTLDFVRTRTDHQIPPWTRPRPPDVFVPINYTERPTETITIEDTVTTSADFYRYFGQIEYPTDADVVNGSQINLLAINASSVDAAPPSNPEMVTLAESIVLSVGFNVALSDSITLAETITEIEGEFAIDSFSFSESITAFTITNKLLNAHTLNEVTLG